MACMGLFETKAVYKTAPLPFMGQKRNFIKKIKNVLSEKKNRQGYYFY